MKEASVLEVLQLNKQENDGGMFLKKPPKSTEYL